MSRLPDMKLIAQSDCGTESDNRTPLSQRKTILTVSATSCHWPIGDPQSADFYLCGAETDGRTSYCERHALLALRPTSPPSTRWKSA